LERPQNRPFFETAVTRFGRPESALKLSALRCVGVKRAGSTCCYLMNSPPVDVIGVYFKVAIVADRVD